MSIDDTFDGVKPNLEEMSSDRRNHSYEDENVDKRRGYGDYFYGERDDEESDRRPDDDYAKEPRHRRYDDEERGYDDDDVDKRRGYGDYYYDE